MDDIPIDEPFHDTRGGNFLVEKVSTIPIIHNDQHEGYEGKKKHPGSNQHEKRHPKDYISTILRAAKESNEQLEKTGSRYRFCVYEEKDKVMIDLVLLDSNGKILKEVKRNITNDDFDKLINNIASIEGLLFDSNG